MKLAKLRELSKEPEVLLCISESFIYDDTIKLLSHVTALIDVAEAAKLVTEQRKLTVFRALSEALERLEAVK